MVCARALSRGALKVGPGSIFLDFPAKKSRKSLETRLLCRFVSAPRHYALIFVFFSVPLLFVFRLLFSYHCHHTIVREHLRTNLNLSLNEYQLDVPR